jgi:hypothetical protein
MRISLAPVYQEHCILLHLQMAKPCTDYSVLRSFKYARHTRSHLALKSLPQYLLVLGNTVNHSQYIWRRGTVIHAALLYFIWRLNISGIKDHFRHLSIITDRRTDIHDEANSRSSLLCERA